MRRMLWILVATATLVLAQQQQAPEPPKANPGDTLKVIDLKQANADSVAKALNGVLGGLAAVTASSGAIIVRGSPDAVRVIEEAVAKLDVAAADNATTRNTGNIPANPVNVDLTAYLLYGAADADASGAIPQDLTGTVQQLRSVFPYQSYRVLDSFVLRSRDGRQTSSSGTLPGAPGQPGTDYRLIYTAAVARPMGAAPRMVHITNLSLRLTAQIGMRTNPETKASQPIYSNSAIETSLDAREGQKTVVGKSNVARTQDAIILVVTPKVIE